MYVTIPHLQVRHNCLIYYELPIISNIGNPDNFKNKSYSGRVTDSVMKRISRVVDLLIQKSPKRWVYNTVTKRNMPFTLNFITLTISSIQLISAREGYEKLLKPFLRKLKYICKTKLSYIWKAELQERGQLHYHVTCNQFIDLTFIRNEWNKLQQKAGYLTHYAKLYKSYNPNSTDVHAVYKVDDIAAYLMKYLSKNDKDVELNGKVWDCSQDLKIKRYSYVPRQRDIVKLNDLVRAGKVELVSLDTCLIYKCKNVKSLLQKRELDELKVHLS